MVMVMTPWLKPAGFSPMMLGRELTRQRQLA
jgi:hypothetical protein